MSELFVTSISKKPNGRIKHIEFIALVPSYTDWIGDTYYKEIKFSGNEKAANDFLDDQIFAHGYKVSEQEDCIIHPNNEDTLIWSADKTGKVATGTIKKLRLREEFVLRCPLITNEKQIYASINEEPQTSSDRIILDSIPKLNRIYEPKTLMVSSACEAMSMDTD